MAATNLSSQLNRLTAGERDEIDFMTGVTSSLATVSDSFVHYFTGPARHPSTIGNDGPVSVAFLPGEFTAAQQDSAYAALQLWSGLTNITFTYSTDTTTAAVVFGHPGDTVHNAKLTAGTKAGPDLVYSSNVPTVDQSTLATITIDDVTRQGTDANGNPNGTGPLSYGDIGSYTVSLGYGIDTLVHEIGHLLGLGHTGKYDGTVNPSTQQRSEYDVRTWSIMSYMDPVTDLYVTDANNQRVLDADGNPIPEVPKYLASYPVDADWAGRAPYTPMGLDIIAAQRLNGAPTSKMFDGNDTFGFNSTITYKAIDGTQTKLSMYDFTVDTIPVVTLYDYGSNNTLDLSGFDLDQIIDLDDGTFSSVAGLKNNLFIEFGTRIDHVIGGSKADVFTLNLRSDVVDGGAGIDKAVLPGTRSDYVLGLAGPDELVLTRRSTGAAYDLKSIEQFQFGADATPVVLNDLLRTSFVGTSAADGTHFGIAANWDNGTVPNLSSQVSIGAGKSVLVTNQETNEVDSLTLAFGSSIDVASGHFVVYNAGSSSTNYGTIDVEGNAALYVSTGMVNNGTIALHGGGGAGDAQMLTQSGTFTLSGQYGKVMLDAGGVIGGRTPSGTDPFDTFINVANAISGNGTIGRKGFANTLNFHNEAFGTVTATGPGLLLLSSATTNAGRLLAAHGTLDIMGAVDQSAGGSISATGADSTIVLDGGAITGGTISALSNATIEVGASTTLRDTILVGHVVLDAGVKLSFAGSVDASGAIIDASAGSIDDPVGALRGATILLPTTPAGYNSPLTLNGGTSGVTVGADATITGQLILGGSVINPRTLTFPLTGSYGSPFLSIDGTVTLSGGGRITFSGQSSGNVPFAINGNSGDSLLDNVDNTISGFGYVGNGSLGLVNETGGTFNAVGGTMVLQGFQAATPGFFGPGYAGPLGITNHGLLEASTGGTLSLLGIVDNAGGRLLAAGGLVSLGGASISSGLLSATAGGRFEVRGDYGTSITTTLSGATPVAAGVTAPPTAGLLNQATIEVDNQGTLILQGAITNRGTIAGTVAGSLPGSTIKVSGTMSLTGGGTLAVANTNFSSLVAGDTLDNVDNLITGYGTIGNGHGYGGAGLGGVNGLALVNESGAGLVAQQGNATFNAAGEMQTQGKLGFKFLELDTGATAMVNKGLVGAGGGTLVIDSVVDSTAGGGIVASSINGKTATVQLAGGTLRGGTITTDAVDTLSAVRVTSTSDVLGKALNGTLDGSAGAVTLTAGSRVIAQDNGVLTLKGALVNQGTVSIIGSSDTYTNDTPSMLSIDTAATLSGGGTVALSSLSSRHEARTQAIGGTTAAAVLRNVDDTISGYGALGHGGLTIVNEAGGTITANAGALQFNSSGIPFSNPENTLIVDVGAGSFTNNGTLQAAGGTVMLRSLVDGTGGGQVKAMAAAGLSGALVLDGGTLRGGTLTTDQANAASGLYLGAGNGTLDGRAGAVTLAAGAHVTVAAARTLTLEGSIVNRGTVALNGNNLTAGAAGFGRLAVAGPTALSGGGTVEMKDFGYALNDRSTHQVISGASIADTLENVDNLIEGSGRLGNGLLGFRNDAAGRVRASVSTLVVDTGATTAVNAGTMLADGGNLTVSSTLDNTGGLVEAKNGVVTLQGFSGGRLQIDATGSAMLSKGMQGGVLEFTGAGRGTGGYIDVAAGQTITATVKGFTDGEGIYLDNVVATGSYAGGVMTLTSNGTVVGRLTMAGATAADSYVAHSDGAGGTVIEHSSTPQTGDVSYTDVVTSTSGKDASDTYSGPVDYLQHQYIWSSPDIVAMSAAAPNSFIKGGDGGDAIMVTSGHNVLDGGGGSNFLIGGTGSDGGSDVFFVDSRENLETWSTIVNFHKGDLATIFGFRDGISTRPYTDVDGAPGYTGVTIHSEINGPGTGIKGSMTFAGIDRATADSHFEITTGTLPGDIGYMLIEYK